MGTQRQKATFLISPPLPPRRERIVTQKLSSPCQKPGSPKSVKTIFHLVILHKSEEYNVAFINNKVCTIL